MHDYIDPTWRELLVRHGLDSFDALWALQAEWFEAPNQRRGGWSGVVRLVLDDGRGAQRVLFLKRQENHRRRSWRHPVGGEPTFAAEIRNILALVAANVPTLHPVYYAQRRVDGRWRAILATEELTGYRPLDAVIDRWRNDGWASARAERRHVIHATAEVARRLHRQRLVHNALHPKHLFVRCDPQGADVRLIDLEKMRRAGSRRRAMHRDLDSLNRRTQHLSRSDRLRFLLHYLGVRSVSRRVRGHWRYFVRRARQRGAPGVFEHG